MLAALTFPDYQYFLGHVRSMSLKETGREKEICKKFYRIGPGIKITIYSVDFFSSVYRVSVKGKKPVNPKPTKVAQNRTAAVEP
jgi:hypothetical protein